MNEENLQVLIKSLTSLPHETEWVEFKENNAFPEEIGEYLSALANSAALHRKEAGYIVWGVSDAPGHPLVGTSFRPRKDRHQNQELEHWLSISLVPRIDFQIHELLCDGKPLVVFCVQPATNQPVRFKGIEYIRIGSCKKPLKEYPEKERALWALFTQVPFEKGVAVSGVRSEQVLSLIEYPAFFRLLNAPLPEDRSGILDRLIQEKVILRKSDDRYDVTNLGGMLFAKQLVAFERLSRKALRVVIYKGVNRVETLRELQGARGYAVGFEGAIRFINDQVPHNEQMGQALRKDVRMYPEIAIRELVANAIIHQDFSATGTGPMVEVFQDRIEITNPGTPLIDPLRFIDEPPQSRNEQMASLMRRMNICEERGSGIDKVVHSVEEYQLPAPDFMATAEHTRTTLFAFRKLAQMDKADRIRACYQHACLCYVSNVRMTNTSLRKRFMIDDRNYPMASRILRDTLDANLIRAYDPKATSGKNASYVPFWA